MWKRDEEGRICRHMEERRRQEKWLRMWKKGEEGR
jgi:hypothetical protein